MYIKENTQGKITKIPQKSCLKESSFIICILRFIGLCQYDWRSSKVFAIKIPLVIKAERLSVLSQNRSWRCRCSFTSIPIGDKVTRYSIPMIGSYKSCLFWENVHKISILFRVFLLQRGKLRVKKDAKNQKTMGEPLARLESPYLGNPCW